MKYILISALLLLSVNDAVAQARTISADEYKQVFDFAVAETNAAFPFIFTVVTEEFESGKVASYQEYINERRAAGFERLTIKTRKGTNVSATYQVRVGFGNVYCSEDGRRWTGPQRYECPRETRLYGPRRPESVEYSVEEKSVSGSKVKVFREYSVFAAATPNGKPRFEETIATVNDRGFFISVVDYEGTLAPRTVELVRKQSWDFKTKFESIKAPVK